MIAQRQLVEQSSGAAVAMRPDIGAAPLPCSTGEIEKCEAAALVALAQLELAEQRAVFDVVLRTRERHWVADEIDVLRRSFGLD